MPPRKSTSSKKSNPSKKIDSSTSEPKRHHPRFGFCLFEMLLILLFVATVSIFGISYFVLRQSVCPNTWNSETFCNSVQNDEESLAIMQSDYPFLRRWIRGLRAYHQLKETKLYADVDSTLLHAYYIPASKPTPNTAIVLHGYKSKALEMLHIAYLYHHDLGFNVVLPDLRTHGKSRGTHIGFGWQDAKDVLQWMEWANDEFGKDYGGQTQMVVHGISMGAATTMFVAGQNKHNFVRAYIEDCGYSSVQEEIAYVADRDYGLPEVPCITLASQMCQWLYGWNFRDASCVEALRHVDTPMLFIHGTADRYVPFDMVHQLYDAKPRNKDIWEVRDVIHARSYHDQREEYTQRVRDFINQYLYNGN